MNDGQKNNAHTKINFLTDNYSGISHFPSKELRSPGVETDAKSFSNVSGIPQFNESNLEIKDNSDRFHA